MTFDAMHTGGLRSKVRQGMQAVLAAAIALTAGGSVTNAVFAAEQADPWPELSRDIFNGRDLNDGAGLIAIEMPYRAEDAAIVPVTLRATLPSGDARTVKAITLVIDQNPAPVAATFRTGAGVAMISTRVRVDSYTNVHAVAELSDGQFYASAVFVKASGGCSAPAAKNLEEAKANLGQMRFRQFARLADGPMSGTREAQIMIRHPNNSGLQRDELVLAMDGGISISEDPNIRFNYLPNDGTRFRVEAVDTDGHVFKGEWPVEAAM